MRFHLTVDRAGEGWPHHVGLVTTLLGPTGLDAVRTTAFVCGPEVMMRAVADDLVERGTTTRASRAPRTSARCVEQS